MTRPEFNLTPRARPAVMPFPSPCPPPASLARGHGRGRCRLRTQAFVAATGPRPRAPSARRRARRLRFGGHPPSLERDRAGVGPGSRASLVGFVGTATRPVPPCLCRSPRPQAHRRRDAKAPLSRARSADDAPKVGVALRAHGRCTPGFCCGPCSAAIWREFAHHLTGGSRPSRRSPPRSGPPTKGAGSWEGRPKHRAINCQKNAPIMLKCSIAIRIKLRLTYDCNFD